MEGAQEAGKYLVSVGAIVRKDKRILFTLRKKGPGAGSWGFPSGFVEPGETLEEAIKREVLEETGIEAEVEGLLGVRNMIYEHKGKLRSEVHLIFLLSWREGEPKADGVELERVHFFTKEEILEQARIGESTRQIIEKALAGQTLRPMRTETSKLPENYRAHVAFV